MNIQNKTNFISKNNSSGIKSVSNETQKVILSIGKAILIVIIILMITYFVYYIYKYYSIQCDTKIPLYQYLTNFGNESFCITIWDTEVDSEGNIYRDGVLTNEKAQIYHDGVLQNNISNNTNHSNSSNHSNNSDEVFQISNQLYTYDEAKCKCESYGGRLANKAELTQAYNNGAHWCNYGWVEGDEAYYPVQQCELDRKAKNIKDYNDMLDKHYKEPEKYTLKMVNEARQKMYRENSLDFCGSSAGLNGGKFEDKNIRFGATCFGKKPDGMSVREKDAKCVNSVLSEDEASKISKEEENKTKCGGVSKDDVITSFNYDTWHQK